MKRYFKPKSISFLAYFLFFIPFGLSAQPVPDDVENIPHLVLFGKNADDSWGDCYHSQRVFFLIPKSYKGPVYIRVFDPQCGGSMDELNGVWDTQTEFSVYGGNGAWSEPDAQLAEPKGNYKSGTLLASKTFGQDSGYERKWYAFGPFDPSKGEYVAKYDGYIFKVISEAITGDDGNLYNYYLSGDAQKNRAISGSTAFAYSYIFRLWDDPNQVSHLYPYVDDKTTAIEEWNYDWDNDGSIVIVSIARIVESVKASGQAEWKHSSFYIMDEERGHSIDIQMHKRRDPTVKNNNVVMFVKGQYNKDLPFFTIPIGLSPSAKPDNSKK